MARSLAFLSALVLLTAANATVVMPEASASPEPMMDDPMQGMALYVVAAGPISGSNGVALGASASVCPADYPAGFSIECKSSYPAATFYINGDGVRKEMTKPFYIAGDANGFVRPWNPPMAMSSLTVACKYGGERVRSKIDFVC